MEHQASDPCHMQRVADIVSAYVAHNSVASANLAGLIASVSVALTALATPVLAEKPELKPAVPIRKSVTPDFIFSLEDGRKFKSMKRHLGLRGMTPADYRTKWGLPSDYPMVAPNYAAQRSSLAKRIGLGRKPGETPDKKRGKKGVAKAVVS